MLWDVDGTLVQAGQVGRDIFTEAYLAVFGHAPDEATAAALVMAGRTDLEIALDFLDSHRIAGAEAHLPAFGEALVTALAAKEAVIRERGLGAGQGAAALDRERGRALPGAEAALAALGRRPDVVQSLLTGNVEANALVKLAAFRLDGYLDFEVGGFGSDHRHRPSLVGVARRKAEQKYGLAFDGVTTAGRTLDQMTIRQWIASRVPGGCASKLGQLLDTAYAIRPGGRRDP